MTQHTKTMPSRSTSASLDNSQTYFRLVSLCEEIRVDVRVGCSLGFSSLIPLLLALGRPLYLNSTTS